MVGLGMMFSQYASVYRACHAAALAIWVSISPASIRIHDASDIADAIAVAVAEDPSPMWRDARREAATMAMWALRESGLRPHVIGDGGRSHGAWQQQRAPGRGDILTQARGWLALWHEAADACGSPEGGLRMVSSGDCGRAERLVARRLGEVEAVVGTEK